MGDSEKVGCSPQRTGDPRDPPVGKHTQRMDSLTMNGARIIRSCVTYIQAYERDHARGLMSLQGEVGDVTAGQEHNGLT